MNRTASIAALVLLLSSGATVAAAAPEAGFETLTPVCSASLPLVHPGCRDGVEYRGAPLPSGTPNQTLQITGADRYATAVAVADHGFPEADVVVLVSGENRNLVDALSAGPLARTLAAPVLLSAQNSLPQATADYLSDHAVASVLVVGGANAVGDGVIAALDDLGVSDVARVAGTDRYATSRAVAALMPDAEHGWAASGEDAHLVDALVAAGPAARLAEPLVLVADDDPIPAGTALTDLGVTSTTVAGGPQGVLPEALAALPAPQRAEGTDRYGTAAALAVEGVDRGLPAQDLVLAPGLAGHLVDALAAGPLGRSTLLVGDDASSQDVIEAWFDTYGAGRTTAVGAVQLVG